MKRSHIFLLLLAASALEAGGDAILRAGLQSNHLWQRCILFGLAAMVLFGYGWTVNTPPWDFGKLIALYVVFFFVIAQLIAWVFFKHPPSTMVVAGGLLIVAGGLVIFFATE